ncbi:hypothetical protein JI664_04620 [Rhodobacter sp. NTK016B]|uniref:hypothetical protein n=1 Tax=Rhodobacter sp. NTK016B TaxID=2759676 RepID=UPI001A8C2B46|nr:hypothetical protein [Rhodobacter sp. NTK016B]MBN8291241.1 hypothetical protein [Rhodobacter sp. NTK016B]
MPQSSAPLVRPFLVRRLLALMVDVALVFGLVTATMVPFTDDGLRLPAPPLTLRSTKCGDLDSAPDWLTELLGAPGPYSLRLCERSLYGLPDGRELRVVLGAETPDRTSRRLVIPVNAVLDPVDPRHPGGLMVLALLLALSAGATRLGWRSPGKALVRLRIAPVNGATPLPLWRETLRLGPLVLIAALPALTGGLPAAALGPGGVIAAVAAGALALVWYYLWPFAHWSGQSRHDRLSRYFVTD